MFVNDLCVDSQSPRFNFESQDSAMDSTSTTTFVSFYCLKKDLLGYLELFCFRGT